MPGSFVRRVLVPTTLLVLVLPSRVHAQSEGASVRERAESLYVEGKDLAQRRRYSEACPKFEESQRLEPAIGTQFNLADCYEHTRRPATALALFREVVRVAQLTGKQERQRSAEERVAALEASVPRLRIVTAAPVPGLSLARDGEPVSTLEPNAGVPVDPGTHVVRATAPGHVPWQAEVSVESGTTDVVVPALAVEPTSAPPAPPSPSTSRSPLAVAGLGVGGIGAVGLVVGSVFGVLAISRKNSADCDGTDCRGATPERAERLRDAQAAGDLSTIFFVAGGALLAGGIALWFAAPRVKTTAAITPAGSSLILERSF
jgi:hypothetical protein